MKGDIFLMKAKEVLSILKITRPTLTKYVKNGTIKVQVLPNGRYDYDEKSVYNFLNKNVERKTVLYCRVSTQKQKQDLKNQEDLLKQFCFSNGIKINNVYKDIASGIDFEKRNDFFIMLDEIIAGKIDTVVITYKDRLSRIGFNLFTYLFQKYNCKIIIVSEIGSTKLDSEEIFEEIVSLLHCYSMKLYSNRRVKKLKEIIYNDKLS